MYQSFTPSSDLATSSGAAHFNDAAHEAHPDDLVKSNTTSQSSQGPIQPIDDFDKMSLQETLLRGIYSFGFEKPSMIQQMAIIPFSRGSDIIVQAQSGTGKTGTYTIGLLQQLDTSVRSTQGLILVPTRELAEQVAVVVQCLGDYMDVIAHSCTGGTRVVNDISALKAKPHVVIGTPGRVHDMINRGVLDVRSLRCVILDEADEMLSLGFIDSIYNIFEFLPKSTQVGVVSATLPDAIHDICDRMLRDPVKIVMKVQQLSLDGITQYYVNVNREEWKLETIRDLFSDISVSQSIIFCNTTRKVTWLTERLAEGFPAACIHGGLTSQERSDVMKRFRNCNIRVLISSDLIARGIDVQQVSIVINYDLPKSKETYLHRIGRSGRFGRTGVAINFATDQDIRMMEAIERHYSIHIKELPNNISEILA